MIQSVLVANRGEIAVRIIRTCRRMRIRTVAVYSDADAKSLHVAEADEAVRIGAPPAAQSYLNQRAIIDAAKQSRAQAIHPGYGFLAENPDFAQKVIDAGLVWIGPPPAAMRALGDKAHAKTLAERHNVPVLPGYHGDDQSLQTLAREAHRIGFPVMIKASAGGGGRGMRIVDAVEELEEALGAAMREARASFDDDRVLLERYVSKPRHVEVQILGDAHGNYVHLGERECSIQRRHQKLIEESPSPAVNPERREQMGEAALRLARAAGYANAGTVEFLLDERGDFAFLELNARLQVEHPVTEAITGLDLVELQLRVAAGEQLSLRQADIAFAGHAIEARIIAEDPLAGFLPSSGTVNHFVYPNFARVDTWIRDGTIVSPYYDSLLAKVISHAATREEAATKLAHALQEIRVEGVHENIDLLLAVVENTSFRAGDLHTRFLEDHQLLEDVATIPPRVMAAVSAVDHLRPPRDDDPWHTQTGWRVGRVDQPAVWSRAGRPHSARVSAEPGGGGVLVKADACESAVRLLYADLGAMIRLSVDGEMAIVWDHDDWRVVEWQGRSYRIDRVCAPTVEDTAGDRGAGGAAGTLTAPMPGRVVKISVQQGAHVSQGQPLVVLEAMKMEHVVDAPHAGVVTELCVETGQQVGGGARLLVIGSSDQTDDVE